MSNSANKRILAAILTIAIFMCPWFSTGIHAENSMGVSIGTSLIDSVELKHNGNRIAYWDPSRGTSIQLPLGGSSLTISSGSTYRFDLMFSQKGMVLEEGDSFSFSIPSFLPVNNITTPRPLYDENTGQKVADYTIAGNVVTITFTDYVEYNHDISGYFYYSIWCSANENTVPGKTLEFIIDGTLVTDPVDVTLIPPGISTPSTTPAKTGTYDGVVTNAATGKNYYVFRWDVTLNYSFDDAIYNFDFTDVLDGPHKFITPATADEMGLSAGSDRRRLLVYEYAGADTIAQGTYPTLAAARYAEFGRDMTFGRSYHLHKYKLGGGVEATTYSGSTSHPKPWIGAYSYPGGLDDTSPSYTGPGISISNVSCGDTRLAAELGDITRPIFIRYYTVCTDPYLQEASFADSGVTSTIKNHFQGIGGIDLPRSLNIYTSSSGGGATGTSTTYPFEFTKTGEGGGVLQGAIFRLFDGPPDMLPVPAVLQQHSSEGDGRVEFTGLVKNRSYYLQEFQAPGRYVVSDAIYKIDVDAAGNITVSRYSGSDDPLSFSDAAGYTFANRTTYQAIGYGTLEGTKRLTGRPLAGSMFSFNVTYDADGSIATTGTNNADGSITFGTITYYEPGTYNYTVSEIPGGQSGYTYDPAEFRVIMDVVDNGDGTLTATPSYPDGGIVFNNTYRRIIIPEDGYPTGGGGGGGGGGGTGGGGIDYTLPDPPASNPPGTIATVPGDANSNPNNDSTYTTIGDMPIPLAQLPYTEIFDDGIPLGMSPMTGDPRSLTGAGALLVVSGACIAFIFATKGGKGGGKI